MIETWKPVKDYENLYEVSNFGNVRTLRNSKKLNKYDIMSKVPHSVGYVRTQLYKDGKAKLKYNHILVAEAFLVKSIWADEINHIDGDKTNNHVNNLEYVTHEYNIHHYASMKRGITIDELRQELKQKEKRKKEYEKYKHERNKKAKRIKELYATGRFKQVELAEMFNLDYIYVWHIINKFKWSEEL